MHKGIFSKYVSTSIGTGTIQMLYNDTGPYETCFNKIGISTRNLSVKLVKDTSDSAW